jgi:hypothetical protein
MKWISVKDEEPMWQEEVLIYGKAWNIERYEIFVGCMEDVLSETGYNWTAKGDGDLYNLQYVTHWMPLPDKPE